MYPSPSVRRFVAEHFVPVRFILERDRDQGHFRDYRVIWTPTIIFIDWRKKDHYRSPGYLPPDLFLQMLHIGLARSQMAWARYEVAATLLTPVANESGSALAPEALYWLGAARFLQTRRRAPMMEAWNRLREAYPESIWAARVPPNQEDFPES